MTSVANQQSQVMLPRKVNTSFDMLLLGRQNHVVGVVATSASGIGIGRGQTCVVGIQWPEIAHGMVGTNHRSAVSVPKHFSALTCIAHPQILPLSRRIFQHHRWRVRPGCCSKEHRGAALPATSHRQKSSIASNPSSTASRHCRNSTCTGRSHL